MEMETWTWRHGNAETWRQRDMETRMTWRHGHGDVDTETWTWKHDIQT